MFDAVRLRRAFHFLRQPFSGLTAGDWSLRNAGRRSPPYASKKAILGSKVIDPTEAPPVDGPLAQKLAWFVAPPARRCVPRPMACRRMHFARDKPISSLWGEVTDDHLFEGYWYSYLGSLVALDAFVIWRLSRRTRRR